MSWNNRETDGVSRLTELMRDEQSYEPDPVEPAVRRSRRRRGLIVTAVIVVAVIGLTTGYVAWASSAPVAAASATSEVPDVAPGPAATIAMSPEGASMISVSGAEEYLPAEASGNWMASGGDEPRSIASITKLITALVILSAKPLSGADDPGPDITFSKADHALYDKYYVLGATIAPMPTGITMSQHQALEAMLIPSASNYAEAMANWAFGSQSGFRTAARDWLAANGMTGTTIVDPTGLDPANTSTPTDMMTLARLAVANPAIVQIVAMPALAVPGIDQLANTNDLLGTGGIDGLKTGTLNDSSNLLFTAKLPVGLEEPVSVTGVVLGGFSHESVNLDVTALLSSIAVGFHDVPVATDGQVLGTYTTPWGDSARMVVKGDASIFTWSDTPIAAELETETVTTGRTGDEVGMLTFTAGPQTVSVPVVLDGSISPPDQWWRLTHPFELGE
jgi:D-alanyl-D-alanine carboxypeptidase (penicillin-binding protein 5/6)